MARQEDVMTIIKKHQGVRGPDLSVFKDRVVIRSDKGAIILGDGYSRLILNSWYDDVNTDQL